jgi:hypothetical protein
LRSKANKYQTWTGKKTDIGSILPQLLNSINNTPQHRTNITPLEAEETGNIGRVFRTKFLPYLNRLDEKSKSTFFPNDLVRISIPDNSKNAFLKKSLPGFSLEIFRVHKIRHTYPVTYTIVDGEGEKVEGHFFEFELLKAEQ